LENTSRFGGYIGIYEFDGRGSCLICFYVEHQGSPVPRAYGYRRTWDIYAYIVRRTPAQLPILYITTITIGILYYIITPPTGTDKVRIEIPIPLDVVLGMYVVRSFTVVITIGLTYSLLTYHRLY
jgi:hypothetical protein